MKKEKSIFWLAELAEKALASAVHKAILDHARTGDPLVLWRNGKVVLVPAKQLLRKK